MEKVTKKIGEFMRSRDSTVASWFFFCNYVVSAEWGWFFFKCTDLKTVHFFQSLPIVSQQRARFEWLQSSNCELGVARPTELATPIYFCAKRGTGSTQKMGFKNTIKASLSPLSCGFFFLSRECTSFFFGCWHERHCGFFLVLLWGLQNLQSSIPAAKLANQG